MVTSIFEELWWLEIAADGAVILYEVPLSSRTRLRLPVYPTSRLGFQISKRPSYTRLFSPLILDDEGPSEAPVDLCGVSSALMDLLDKYRKFSLVQYVLGTSSTLAPAFVPSGFTVEERYTFVSCGTPNCKRIWDGMHQKTRNVIRRAEKSQIVRRTDDIGDFIAMSKSQWGRNDTNNYPKLSRLWQALVQRDQGAILTAFGSRGKPLAKCMLIWDRSTMYYFLSTRALEKEAHNSNSLLIWHAIKSASERGLSFDLDGHHSRNSFKFQARFGLSIAPRKFVQRRTPVWGSLAIIRDWLRTEPVL